MDNDEALQRHNEMVSRLDAMVAVMRRGSHYQAFRFNTGSNVQCYVQKTHCFIDGLHNPTANPINVTLLEEGQVMYSDTVVPGGIVPMYGMPFMRQCILLTDGASITIWGRIRN